MSDEASNLAEQLTAIQQQLAFLSQQLAALYDQQRELAAQVALALPRRTGDKAVESAEHPHGAPVREVLAKCGQDILRVLREVGRPLTTLEILDELVHRHLSWRESTVSHTIAELLDQRLIRDSGDHGPRRHGLVLAPH